MMAIQAIEIFFSIFIQTTSVQLFTVKSGLSCSQPTPEKQLGRSLSPPPAYRQEAVAVAQGVVAVAPAGLSAAVAADRLAAVVVYPSAALPSVGQK